MGSRFYDLSEKDTWQTPSDITDTLSDHCDITLDPCAGLFTFIGSENWTIEVPEREEIPHGLRVQSVGNSDYDLILNRSDGSVLRCGADSLARPWDTGGTAFVNPPFSMKNDFIDKTLEEYDEGNIDRAIILTPDSTDVKSWWHGKLKPYADYVWFSEGRISFINPDTGEVEDNPTFGTALHFIGDGWDDTLFEALANNGDMMRRM